jgi:hypothetical protein
MSKKSSTFAVDFQGVHNHKLLSRMKTFIRYITLSVVLLLAVACDPDGPAPDPGPFHEFVVSPISSQLMPYVLADTVTPPSNPMAPGDLSSYPTFTGVLTLTPVDFDNIRPKYVCGMYLLKPISYKCGSGDVGTISTLHLLDRDSRMLIRFDHPMLQSCVVGDTILVTGTPVEINGGLGITMYYVQPQ